MFHNRFLIHFLSDQVVEYTRSMLLAGPCPVEVEYPNWLDGSAIFGVLPSPSALLQNQHELHWRSAGDIE